MSRPISRLPSRAVTIANSAEVFEVIRERTSTTPSSININDTAPGAATATGTTNGVATVTATDTKPEEENEAETENPTPTIICPCKAIKDAEQENKNAEEIQRLLQEKEMEMEDKFQERVAHEIHFLKERFEFILQNEQIRASHMLREAHREREEKISALQTQLECKNMAGLMYVLCAERRKSKMEILRLKEEYTNYIQALQEILTESQALILNLSRGYKTAARVDHEWREKMTKIIKHFQNFVNNFTGCPPESNQYLFNLPDLLKIKAPLEDNPCEDPCEEEEEESEENEIEEVDRTWWNTLEGDDRPFVMFGDMADFKPPQRRQVLRAVKAQKTAPRKWKEYVFHDMFLKADCPNNDVIKDKLVTRVPPPTPVDKWEFDKQASFRGPEFDRRVTTPSVDLRGNKMGSILKIITSQFTPQTKPTTKSTLLAARDSMEIASTTRLMTFSHDTSTTHKTPTTSSTIDSINHREKHKHPSENTKVVVSVGHKIDSMFDEMNEGLEEEQDEKEETGIRPRNTTSKDEEDFGIESQSALGSIHNDSLQIIPQHVPDQDHKLQNEKICPMEKCQKMQMDDFMRSLPSYMRASPFTHFEQTYEDYEPCTPEQLEILKQRLEEKKKKEHVVIDVTEDDPLLSWTPSIAGIGVQTSYDDIYLPPCTCEVRGSNTSDIMSQMVYNIADLIPVKQKLEKINAECFFNDDIEFNRFKVIGQDDNEATNNDDKENFNKKRLQEIKRILKQHPSLCEIFQANIRC